MFLRATYGHSYPVQSDRLGIKLQAADEPKVATLVHMTGVEAAEKIMEEGTRGSGSPKVGPATWFFAHPVFDPRCNSGRCLYYPMAISLKYKTVWVTQDLYLHRDEAICFDQLAMNVDISLA